MEQGLLSIIVPVYNSRHDLARCVESILAQTYSNLEVILVDDGSTDNSGSLCDNYAREDTRVKAIHKANGGQQDARSAGIAAAKGEWIGFVDSDDWIERDMYEALISDIENADLAASGFFKHDKTGNIIGIWTDPLEEGFYTGKDQMEYLYNNLIIYNGEQGKLSSGGITACLWCKLFRASIVKKIYQKANVFIKNEEDFLFCFLYLLECKKIRITHKYYYHYMENAGSVMHRLNFNYLHERNILYLAVDQALKGHWMEAALKKQFQKRFMYGLLNGLYHYMQFDEAIGIPAYSYANEKEIQGKRIVLFGAGKVGRSFYRDIKAKNMAEVVSWIDNDPPEEEVMGMRISHPERILVVDYDYIVCSVLQEGQAKAMKEQLAALGILEDKVLWREPVCMMRNYFFK